MHLLRLVPIGYPAARGQEALESEDGNHAELNDLLARVDLEARRLRVTRSEGTAQWLSQGGRRAFSALEQVGGDQVIAALASYLEHPSSRLSFAAATALDVICSQAVTGRKLAAKLRSEMTYIEPDRPEHQMASLWLVEEVYHVLGYDPMTPFYAPLTPGVLAACGSILRRIGLEQVACDHDVIARLLMLVGPEGEVQLEGAAPEAHAALSGVANWWTHVDVADLGTQVGQIGWASHRGSDQRV